MGWSDVDRKGGGGRYLSLEDGETRRVRILDEEPHTILLHKISQVVDDEDVFITVPATPKADDDYVNQKTKRYPALPQHNLRVLVFDDNGDPESIQVLAGGVQIFRPLKQFHQRYGDVRQFDVEISRDGEGLKTKYSVTMVPDSYEVDLDEWLEELESDDALQWETLFPPITAEEQEKMIDEAGIDIEYDPVLEIMEEMDVEEALATRLTFGKYGPDKYPPKGKTIGEVLAIDSGWMEWAAENVTSDDTIAAAARIAVQHMGEVEAPKAKKKVSSGSKSKKGTKASSKKTKAKGKGKKGAEEGSESRDSLISRINAAFDQNEEFTEAMEIVEVIKKHGNGKTKIKDLTVDEMESLLAELEG